MATATSKEVFDLLREDLEAIERERIKAEAATEWPHRSERLTSLEKIETKLQQTDNNAIEPGR